MDEPKIPARQDQLWPPRRTETLDRSIRQMACDRCGARMFEESCKIVCRNCGHRFDCSDLNLYFD